MKKILFALSLVSLLTACGGTATTSTTSSTEAPDQSISIANFAFTPKAITVKVGDTVEWTNVDTASHTVTSDSFASATLTEGDSFRMTFDTAGTFDYKCTIHPSMTGTINVQ